MKKIRPIAITMLFVAILGGCIPKESSSIEPKVLTIDEAKESLNNIESLFYQEGTSNNQSFTIDVTSIQRFGGLLVIMSDTIICDFSNQLIYEKTSNGIEEMEVYMGISDNCLYMFDVTNKEYCIFNYGVTKNLWPSLSNSMGNVLPSTCYEVISYLSYSISKEIFNFSSTGEGSLIIKGQDVELLNSEYIGNCKYVYNDFKLVTEELYFSSLIEGTNVSVNQITNITYSASLVFPNKSEYKKVDLIRYFE